MRPARDALGWKRRGNAARLCLGAQQLWVSCRSRRRLPPPRRAVPGRGRILSACKRIARRDRQARRGHRLWQDSERLRASEPGIRAPHRIAAARRAAPRRGRRLSRSRLGAGARQPKRLMRTLRRLARARPGRGCGRAGVARRCAEPRQQPHRDPCGGVADRLRPGGRGRRPAARRRGRCGRSPALPGAVRRRDATRPPGSGA